MSNYNQTAKTTLYFMLGMDNSKVTLRSYDTSGEDYWDEICLGSEEIILPVPARTHEDILAQGVKKYEADKTTLQAETQLKLNALDEKIAQLKALPAPSGSAS